MMTLIAIVVIALAVAVFGALGAIVGLYAGLYVVSRKLTGTAWTFEDISDVFRQPPNETLQEIADIEPPEGISKYFISDERDAWRDLFYRARDTARRR